MSKRARITMDEDQRLFARDALAKARAKGELYDGSEEAYEALLSHFIEFEVCAREVGTRNGLKLETHKQRTALEKAVAKEVQPDVPPVSIDDLFDLAHRSLFQALGQGRSAVNKIQTDFCFLPTSGQSFLTRREEDEKGADARALYEMMSRLEPLLVAMRSHGVYADDLVVIEGQNRPSMMRATPYHLIQIPRLDREVLICNALNEAIFIGKGLRGPLFWATHAKEHLKDMQGIQRLTTAGDWTKRTIAYLFDDNFVRAKKTVKEVMEKLDRGTYPLSYDLILIHALRYAAKNGGKLPTHESGAVEGVPGQTWGRWHAAIRRSFNGLEDRTYKGLSDFFNDYGLKMGPKENPEAIAKVCRSLEETGGHGLQRVGKVLLTYDLILNEALKYAAKNGRKLPGRKSGAVEGFPGQLWAGWDAAIAQVSSGLEDRKYKGISDIYSDYGLKMGLRENPDAIKKACNNLEETGSHGLQRVGKVTLTYDLILNEALKYAAKNGGKLPTLHSGAIDRFPGQVWRAWNYAISQASDGLEDRNYKGLADLFNDYGLKMGQKENPELISTAFLSLKETGAHGLQRVGKVQLTYDMILGEALKYAAKNGGKLPTQDCGAVEGYPGQLWTGWQSAIQNARNGLEDRNYTGLSDLFNDYGLKTGYKENPEVIAKACRSLDETGSHGLQSLRKAQGYTPNPPKRPKKQVAKGANSECNS